MKLPRDTVGRVTIGLSKPLKGGTVPRGVLVIHGPQKAATVQCVKNLSSEIASQGAKLSEKNGVLMISKANEHVAMSHVDDATTVIMLGETTSADAMRSALRGSTGLSTSAGFMGMYDQLATDRAIWMFARSGGLWFESSDILGFAPWTLFATAQVGDGVELDLRIRVRTDTDAADLAADLQRRLARSLRNLDRMRVSHAGSDVTIAAAASKGQLGTLATLWVRWAFGG